MYPSHQELNLSSMLSFMLGLNHRIIGGSPLKLQGTECEFGIHGAVRKYDDRPVYRKAVSVYSSGISTSPELIPSMTSCGGWPSIVHPMLWAVPRISFTQPDNSFASDLNFIVRAMSTTSSRVMFPLCLIFFSFLRSRGGSKMP